MKHKTLLNPTLILSLILASVASLISPLAAFADGGGTWSANVKVNDDVGSASRGEPYLMADTNGALYLAWGYDTRNGHSDIYFAKSVNGGTTWSANTKVNDGVSSIGGLPSMVIDSNGILYIAWYDNRAGNRDIYFSKSTDGGVTWSANVKISDDPGSTEAGVPSLAVDSSNHLYVAWQDNRSGNVDIYFSKSTNGGTTWSAGVKVNDGATSTLQQHAKVIVDNSGNLYMAWNDSRNGGQYLYFSKSTNGGATWNANVRITDVAGHVATNGPPPLTVDGSGNLYVVWNDERAGWGHSHLYFSKSSDGGSHWSANVDVSNNPNDTVYEPGLVVDRSGNLYAIWGDNRADGAGDWDVYFARSTDGGASWSGGVKVNDDTTSRGQFQTSLAIDGNDNIYAAWTDGRNGNADIYFSSLISSSSIVATSDSSDIYPGDPVSIDLNIQNANGLYAAQAICLVDPGVLTPQDGTYGDFFDPVNRLEIPIIVDPETGSWTAAISQRNPALPLSGGGLFATANFLAAGAGTTVITCEPLLSDRDGNLLAVSFTGTSITVIPFGVITGSSVKYQGRTHHGEIIVTATGIVTQIATTDNDGVFSLDQLKGKGDSYQVKADAPLYLPACKSDVAVTSGQTVTLTATTLLGGDLNDDDVINIGDATRLGAGFGTSDPGADINADTTVNVQDLAILGGNFDLTGCQAW